MDTFSFGKERGRAIEAYESVGATAVHLLGQTVASVVTIYLEPNGVLGMHPAAADQLLLKAKDKDSVKVLLEGVKKPSKRPYEQ